MTRDRFARLLSVLAVGFVLLVMPARVLGQSDGMDGPVVKTAQRALARGDVSLVLVWVKANAAIDEGTPAPVLSTALYRRFTSRGEEDFAGEKAAPKKGDLR